MLKKLFISCLITLAFSCGKDMDGYKISGQVNDVADSTNVFLNVIEDKRLKAIDTTIVLNNTFEFTGTVAEKDVHFISIDKIRSSAAIILENAQINLTLYKDSLHTSIVEGTKENYLLQQYAKNVSKNRKKIQEATQNYRQAGIDKDSVKMKQSRDLYDSLVKSSANFDEHFIAENVETLMGVFVLERTLNSKSLKMDKIKELYDKLPETSKQGRSGKTIAETLERALATAEGSVAPNFTAPTPEGEMLALNDVKGKVTIIDFWAAWCGPCRKENPNVVKVYEKYHDKGLEIIGVSLDGSTRQNDPKAAWVKAIEDDKLTWHQVSNLKYFNDEVAKLYNITSIPATFILDAEGKIVAKNLRGQALDDKIAELLN